MHSLKSGIYLVLNKRERLWKDSLENLLVYLKFGFNRSGTEPLETTKI